MEELYETFACFIMGDRHCSETNKLLENPPYW